MCRSTFTRYVIAEAKIMAGQEFKDNVDAVVERLVNKLEERVFLEVMPDQADKMFLKGLHSR